MSLQIFPCSTFLAPRLLRLVSGLPANAPRHFSPNSHFKARYAYWPLQKLYTRKRRWTFSNMQLHMSADLAGRYNLDLSVIGHVRTSGEIGEWLYKITVLSDRKRHPKSCATQRLVSVPTKQRPLGSHRYPTLLHPTTPAVLSVLTKPACSLKQITSRNGQSPTSPVCLISRQW